MLIFNILDLFHNFNLQTYGIIPKQDVVPIQIHAKK